MDKKKVREIIRKCVTMNGIPIGELIPESKEENLDKELKLNFNINVTSEIKSNRLPEKYI